MKTLLHTVIKPVVNLASRLDWLALLIARLGVGWIFAPGGWEKLHTLEQFAAWFATLGIPFPFFNALMTALVELIGGVCVMLGLGTRFFSVALSVIMLVALITVGPTSNPPPASLSAWLFKSESILILILLVFMAYGPGKASIDQIIRGKMGWDDERR